MEKLYEILKSLHPDVDFTAQDDLIGEGILDSLDIVTLNLSAFMFIPTVGKVFPEIGEDRLEQMLSGRKAEIITLIKSRLYGNRHE